MAKILVVDDHAVNRELVVTLVRHRGHEPFEAGDGAEALELVRRHRPDLVVSDILMPTMDGFEFVRQLRADPRIESTEVIFYTAHYREREAQNLARSCGVSRVLTKPAEPEDILRALDDALSHAARPAEPAVAEPAFDREHLRLVSDKLARQVADLQAANQRLAALTEVTLHLASERDPHALLEGVCREARSLLVGRYALLCARLKDPDGTFFTACGLETGTGGRPAVPADTFATALAAGAPWRGSGKEAEALLPPQYPRARSVVVAPIVSPSTTYGWIAVFDKVGAAQFDVEDERVLAGLAAQLGRIYENGNLYIQLQRHAEQLRERENRLHQAQKLARLGHVVTDAAGDFVSWSATVPMMIGRDEARMPRSTREWLALVHPDDRARFRSTSIAASRAGTATHFEYRVRHADGHWIHFRQAAEPVAADAGQAARPSWMSTIIDFSDQKRAEEALRESERRFREMMAKVDLASLMLDHSGRVTYCNDCMLRLTGWSLDEVIGRDGFELFAPQAGEEMMRKTFSALLEDQPSAWHIEAQIHTRSGELRVIRWNNSVLRSDAGEVVGTASIGEDVTERRRAEEEVRRLNEDLERRVHERTAELEAANQELESYDYSISHDLRAPLNRIRGFGSALLEDHAAQLDASGQDYLRRIVSASDAMNDMIADILRLSTWTKVELNRTPVDLGAIGESILKELSSHQSGRDATWRIAPGLGTHCDLGLIRVVLENLLGNAWKFTSARDAALIEVGSTEGDGETVFWVRDNGSGFDEVEAAKLFKPFQRLASSGKFPGSGVGLAIVQRIIARHGGRLWGEGRPGVGATFCFTLGPASRPPGEVFLGDLEIVRGT